VFLCIHLPQVKFPHFVYFVIFHKKQDAPNPHNHERHAAPIIEYASAPHRLECLLDGMRPSSTSLQLNLPNGGETLSDIRFENQLKSLTRRFACFKVIDIEVSLELAHEHQPAKPGNRSPCR
jgi:hypothetical protein